MSCLRQQAKENIRKYVDERLLEEYEKCLVGVTSILKEAWNTAQTTEDKREKIQALSLAKECYSMKLDLLTNATVVDDDAKFFFHKSTTALHQTKIRINETTAISEKEIAISTNDDSNSSCNI